MRAASKSSLHKERGQNLVELAVIITVLLLLVLGVIDLGRALYIKVEIANSARAGALYGSQSPSAAADNTGITYAVQHESADLSGLITATSSSYACYCSGGAQQLCSSPSSICGTVPLIGWVTVTTQATYTPWLHVPFFGLPNTYTIEGFAEMPVSGL